MAKKYNPAVEIRSVVDPKTGKTFYCLYDLSMLLKSYRANATLLIERIKKKNLERRGKRNLITMKMLYIMREGVWFVDLHSVWFLDSEYGTPESDRFFKDEYMADPVAAIKPSGLRIVANS